jgi:glycosyltransferase involved in cell wall biosynthesis
MFNVMKIGIDFFGFNPDYAGGVNTFSLGLVNGLIHCKDPQDEIIIFISEKNEKNLKMAYQDSPVTFVTISSGYYYRFANKIVCILSWLIRNFKLRFWMDKYFRFFTMRKINNHVDVLLVPASVLNFYALKIPTVLCIHDIQQEYHPDLFSFNERVLRWSSYRLSCWKANAIQVSSLYIKNCLIEKYKFVEQEKIFIAFEGVDINKFSLATQNIDPLNRKELDKEGFIFYPAQFWPHKNHLLLIKALSIFRDKAGYELPCVLTGYDYGHWPLVQESIKKHKLNNVYYLGRVDFSAVLWLYQNCKAVLAIGLHESSSLPVREGAVFGKPIICSDIPPNIEAQKFFFLKLFNGTDPFALADIFNELMLNPKEMLSLSVKNAKFVKNFHWNLIANKYIDVFNRIA